MFKMVRGKSTLKFGKAEAKLSLNWKSLSISLLVAILGWVSADLIPALTEHEGYVSVIAGILAQIVPMVILYLRDNSDIVLEDKIPLDKKKQ